MTEPLRVYIVDDEAIARSRLRALLQDCQPVIPNVVVGEAEGGAAAVDALAKILVDVVLLDIHMPGMDGLVLARHLLHLPHPPSIIFVTAYDAHAVSAFEVGALDYLLKPIRAKRLEEALRRARRLTEKEVEIIDTLAPKRRHFAVNDRGRVLLVPVGEVLYLRAELKYVTLRTREREFVLGESLTHLETEFSDSFIRIHRNCLVNRNHLAGFELQKEDGDAHWMALLRDWPECLPVSRRQAHVIKALRQGRSDSILST